MLSALRLAAPRAMAKPVKPWARPLSAVPSCTPTEIKYVKAERALYVAFGDGERYRYPAEYLRVESPSAEVQGHGEGKRLVSKRAHVGIFGVERVGNYAVRLKFDDLHDTGIYSWEYLLHLGRNKVPLMRSYVRRLQERNLSRFPKQ